MRWVPLLMALPLAACAPGFDWGPDPGPDPGLAPRSVRVLAVAGPPLPMGRLLARSVAEALARRDIPAGLSGGLAGGVGYVLEGRTEVNLNNPGSPYIVFIHWTLRDRGGASVGTHSQGVRGTWLQWEYGDPRIIRAVGARTAEAVLGLLP